MVCTKDTQLTMQRYLGIYVPMYGPRHGSTLNFRTLEVLRMWLQRTGKLERDPTTPEAFLREERTTERAPDVASTDSSRC
jgi:hypothetical protein